MPADFALAVGRVTPIPLAVVGAGWAFENCYLPHLADGRFVVRSIYDPDDERARAMQTLIPTAEIVGSIGAACAGTRATLITSPSPLHVQQCVAALTAGQMVLCEKPVVMRPSDYQQLIERSTRRSFVVPAAVCRYRSDARRWLAACSRAGQPRRLALSWLRSCGTPGFHGSWHTRASGGWTGVLPDLGYHLVDLAVLLLGGEVRDTRIERLTHGNSGTGRSAAWYGRAAQVPLEVPDDFCAELRIDGTLVSIRVCWNSSQAGDLTRLEFHGDRGAAILSTLFGFSDEARESVHFCEFRADPAAAERFEVTRGPGTHAEAFRDVLEGFALACEQGAAPGEQARLRSTAMIMDLLRCSEN